MLPIIGVFQNEALAGLELTKRSLVQEAEKLIAKDRQSFATVRLVYEAFHLALSDSPSGFVFKGDAPRAILASFHALCAILWHLESNVSFIVQQSKAESIFSSWLARHTNPRTRQAHMQECSLAHSPELCPHDLWEALAKLERNAFIEEMHWHSYGIPEEAQIQENLSVMRALRKERHCILYKVRESRGHCAIYSPKTLFWQTQFDMALQQQFKDQEQRELLLPNECMHFNDLAFQPTHSQLHALQEALSHKMTLVVGLARSGKTSLIAAILSALSKMPVARGQICITSPWFTDVAAIHEALEPLKNELGALGLRLGKPRELDAIFRKRRSKFHHSAPAQTDLGQTPKNTDAGSHAPGGYGAKPGTIDAQRIDETQTADESQSTQSLFSYIIIDEAHNLSQEQLSTVLSSSPIDCRFILLLDPNALSHGPNSHFLHKLLAMGQNLKDAGQNLSVVRLERSENPALSNQDNALRTYAQNLCTLRTQPERPEAQLRVGRFRIARHHSKVPLLSGCKKYHLYKLRSQDWECLRGLVHCALPSESSLYVALEHYLRMFMRHCLRTTPYNEQSLVLAIKELQNYSIICADARDNRKIQNLSMQVLKQLQCQKNQSGAKTQNDSTISTYAAYPVRLTKASPPCKGQSLDFGLVYQTSHHTERVCFLDSNQQLHTYPLNTLRQNLRLGFVSDTLSAHRGQRKHVLVILPPHVNEALLRPILINAASRAQVSLVLLSRSTRAAQKRKSKEKEGMHSSALP